MFFKSRIESTELKLFRSLNARVNLSAEKKQYYLNLEKGFEGEKLFDELLDGRISDDWLILNDLLLKINNTFFQIDSLLISHDTIYLFEVKNYKGDFYIQSEIWYSLPKKEIKNPLHQLERNDSSLRRLLQDLGFNFQVESHLIFINPEFTLYQTPLNQPIIFPTQLDRFLKKLSMKNPRIKDRHLRFAEQLVAEHSDDSPFTQLPSYDYDDLKKGIICTSCNRFMSMLGSKKLVCDSCGCEDDVETAVMRSVEEFRLLFPERKITTNVIVEWCKVVTSKKTVRRILGKNLNQTGIGRHTYYVDNI